MSEAENVNLPTKKNKKRQRSENWLEEDKYLLTELVRERVSFIENKNTDTNTNSKKLEAWSDLANSFNSMCKGNTRTLAQLKTQWGVIKMSKKKKKAEERKLTFMTGGGPPPTLEPEDGNDISVWLPNEFVTDENKFDSDHINLIKIGQPSHNKFTNLKIDKDDKENVSMVETPDIVIVDSAVEEDAEITVLEVQETPRINQQPIQQTPSKNKYSRRGDKNMMTTYSEQITATETKCRTELHEIQMENEKQKQKNLALKEILIQKKIEFYQKRLQNL